MCKVLKVSRSCYYRWYSGGVSIRELENKMFSILIKQIFNESKQRYGSPRITAELRNKGYIISKLRVAKLMRLNGLRSKVKRKYKITTDSNHSYSISKNHLNREFTPDSLNEVWVSDITYVRTAQGWLYFTAIIDLYDRQVIGWSLSKSLSTKDTILPAWRMALSKRKIEKPLIFHSDRGVQYASNLFRSHIKSNTLIKQSMSRKGNCWDNAVAESFFKTLKSELIYHEKYESILQAKSSIFEYIETWYNRKRLHSALGYKTPVEMEEEFNKLKYVA